MSLCNPRPGIEDARSKLFHRNFLELARDRVHHYEDGVETLQHPCSIIRDKKFPPSDTDEKSNADKQNAAETGSIRYAVQRYLRDQSIRKLDAVKVQ
ncbi:hypothetical protein T265_15956, partial [Opisthorchis viverrini]